MAQEAPPPKNNRSTAPNVSLLSRLIATGLFVGYIPWASGTFGSLVGLLWYEIPGVERPFILACCIVAGLPIGALASARVARAVRHQLNSTAKALKEKFQPAKHAEADPSIVVIDEIVGMWISLFFLPKTLWISALAFAAFRAYDIIKPPPARQLEGISNGWGIMLDDVAAGIYANLTVRLCLMVFPGIG